jgi:hypothetical protein
MEDDFLKTLLKNPVQRSDEQSLQVIDSFCQSIRDYTSQKVECWREPGFATSFGQEWRVTIKPAARAYQQILFRAYVPLNGYPVQIDLYAGEMTKCANEAALRKVLNNFLKQRTVQETIEYLSNSASVSAAG